ncbi:uncharacterized protein mslnb [Sphaeramia orbicularis]|uniref:uncharacterized protein mslnb n=1 Tax=Sphaeramia orbicularis TaxID=375764 RepID=UPI00117C183B|nr:uncharacterized protein LOC115413648 [Sphaeramia orbicularis]
MMRSCYLFLLVYLLGNYYGTTNAQRNVSCVTGQTCGQEGEAGNHKTPRTTNTINKLSVIDPASYFLQCVGLQSTDTGRDHMRRLKQILEALMDVYTFMRSSMTGVPLLSFQGVLDFNHEPDPLQNEALVEMWLEVKIKPLLKSITKHFLSCLSTKNFSCSTYQMMVKEFSHHFSEMNPVRQKWIYTFFMYPFLSGHRVAGCVKRDENSEDWLMKNFGAFSVMARVKDFSTLNMVFSGLEVLHLLSPAQKAELLLNPHIAGLDNDTLSLVFHSLMTGGSGPRSTMNPGGHHNWTTPGHHYGTTMSPGGHHTPTSPGHPLTYPGGPKRDPYRPPSPHHSLNQISSVFGDVFRPVSSFVHGFVSFTKQRNMSEIRSTTLTQFLLNWTLAELAQMYRLENTSVPPERPQFDVTNVEDWYQHVVMPVLRRFLNNDQDLMHQNLTYAFHHLFYLDKELDSGEDNQTSEIQDVCSIRLDKHPCGLTDAVVHVARVVHCAARTNLTMSEDTVMTLVTQLTRRLNLLIGEFATANFTELASEFREIFSETEPPSLTQEHLNDPDFIQLWFQIKLLPLLPDVPIDLLFCLSTKNFTCPVYQTIVEALGKQMSFMDAGPMYNHNIYGHFIYPFLLHHNTSDPQCVSSANNSAEWLQKNIGFFSVFGSVTDFYQLNPHFSGLETLPLLSPKQKAQMLLLPLPHQSDKDVVIDRVFDFLLESPEDRKYPEVLHYLVHLAMQVGAPCAVYRNIFEQLYRAIPSVPPAMEPVTWTTIEKLIKIAPEKCVPENITCPVTQFNEHNTCKGHNSSHLESYLNQSASHMNLLCSFPLEKYACAKLENFTAHQLAVLLQCDLPGNSSHSKVVWKMLLTKLSFILDPALDILADMSMTTMSPSASQILDVIGEIRVSTMTDEQLRNSSVIRLWFSSRLRAFLPAASEMFLHCLIRRNMSCHSYQQILQVFSHLAANMTEEQQHVVLEDFILVFLSQNQTGPGCVSGFNSSEWLKKNLGPFSKFLSLIHLLHLNPAFNPLEALQLLTPKQIAEMLMLNLPTLPEKNTLINILFDYLTESPGQMKFQKFLSFLPMVVAQGNFSCSSIKTLFTRMDLAMATAPLNTASTISYIKLTLSKNIPLGCIIYSGQCNVTLTNETDICVGVNSTMLQLHLDNGQMDGRFCDFPVEEFACASLSALTAQDLAEMLKCSRSSNSSGSRAEWKLLLTKASHVLDDALDLLATMMLDPTQPAVSLVLDAIREIRLDSFSVSNLNHPAIIKLWFKHRLGQFLPAVSKDFLSCLTTRGLNCSTYQQILQVFSHLAANMTEEQQHVVLEDFILVFLSQNQTGPGCVSGFNSSEWLKKNLGPFSKFLSLIHLLHLNPAFNPLEALQLLTPKQIAEMLMLNLPTLPEKNTLINILFDYLTESPGQMKFQKFLSFLPMVVAQGNFSCSSIKTLFTRMDLAMATAPLNTASTISYIKLTLSKNIPLGCIIYSGQCNVTLTNETDICVGVNSTMLQLHLDNGQMDGRFCDFPVEEFACASLSALTAQDLAEMLKCSRSSNSSGSRAEWKLLLTKASHVLDDALDLLATMMLDPTQPAVSLVLDAIREIRLDSFSVSNLNHPAIIKLWFKHRLGQFLPAVSKDFLSCLTTRGLNCSTYQQILQVFSHLAANMTEEQQHVVLEDFILVFLSQNQTGPGCVSGFNSSEWLKKNLGPFSKFLSLIHLLHLNPAFNPLEALQLLTPKQIAEMLMLNLPTLPEKNTLINILFDYLTESPGQMKFQKFLSFLPMVVAQGNFSCSSIKTLFTRMDLAMATAPLNTASTISYIKLTLSKNIPLGCIIYSGQCNVTLTNETDICVGVNSTMLQLHLDNGQMDGRFCDFPVEEFACASLSALTAQDLAEMLKCSRSSNSSGSRAEWKLLLTKASHVLDDALDLLATMMLDPTQPAVSLVLDAIREIRLDSFSVSNLNHPAIIKLWFKRRLGQFLPAVSKDFLSCLTTRGLNCSTYQQILQILSGFKSHMPLPTQMLVYTHFIQVFLTRNDTADPYCSLHINNSGVWLQKNLGAFSDLVTFNDLLKLYPDFSAMEALQQMTVRQLAEVASTPNQLASPAQVVMVMNHVPNNLFAAFFDDFSPAIMGHENMIPHMVRSAILGVVFQRGNLSHHSVGDSAVLVWLHNRLRPLLVGLDSNQVAPFFNILLGRNCSTEQQGIQVLNSTISSLSEDTKKQIHDHIIETLKGGTPLRCYGNNYNHSFYGFLESQFMGFQFPNLTSFVSLMPHDRMPLLLNSMPPSDLGAFLRRPDTVDNDAMLCAIYHNYDKTQIFLEEEDLPVDVQRPTLPCVWPMALTSTKRSEVNAWFDRSLRHYLTFLTKSLISPSSTYNASCLAFQKLVSVMGNYNYTAADFVSRDMFDTIRVYLTSASNPRCYNATDPELNSTAWFAEYIGFFFQFLTLEDLLMLGSSGVIQVFTVNPANIALLNHSSLPLNLTNYYTELIYLQDSNFNPLILPLICRCVAPGPAFMQLTAAQSLEILSNLTMLCTDLDPQVAAALSGNFGDNIDSSTISALGMESNGLSTGQINMIKAKDLMASLSILSRVTDWNEGQAKAIIRILMTTMTINNASSLLMLGSLIGGVPSSVIINISGSQLLNAGGNNAFVTHLISAPQIIQQTFVAMIVKINENSEVIVDNVPDDLASEIPRASLLGFSGTSNFLKINKKKWKRQQVELFFGVVAVENATSAVGGTANLSSSVLQGFTCTAVRTIQEVQIKRLIKACRRKNKVTLVETQLTCMYNYIRGDSDVTSFELFPQDVLLYYDYSLVPQSKCRSYFEQLSDADFSVFSNVLSYKRTALFDNARSCLGITNTSLTEDNISVLGNMCCTLDGAYIENSDPSILEKLNNCPELSNAQATAVETLLVSGRTKYRAVSTWNEQTLRDLGMLPLYMTSTFYDHFPKKTKKTFLKYFLKVLKSNKVPRRKRRQLKKEVRMSIKTKTKRSVECTVGVITQVTISDETFPFDYDDINQFDSCLSNTTVKNNLAAITDKVDDKDYLRIVLRKLREAYSTGASASIPEDQVQLLGPAACVATVEDINVWTITTIDTLSALMDPSDGTWDPSLAKAVITKYLSIDGNSLGTAELNALGGVNLCSLDVDVLKTITEQSLKDANELDVSNCTLEKKKALFDIAVKAFNSNTRSTVSVPSYQLSKSYLGGASQEYIRSLVPADVNMDMATFTSLDENVVLNLTVDEVGGLLGTNKPELKSYENQSLVQNWISRQLQTDLDKLGVGLTGGIVRVVTPTNTTVTSNSVTVTPSPGATSNTKATAAPVTSTITTAKPPSATTAGSATTGNGPRLRPDLGLSVIVLFVLIATSQLIFD